MTKEFDTLVLIGRFEPVTAAHVAILQKAVKLSKELIIIIGSAQQPRTFKNPWNFKERQMMVNNVLNTIDTDNCRVFIEPMVDTVYNNAAWAGRVHGVVSKYRMLGGRTGIIETTLLQARLQLEFHPQCGARCHFPYVGRMEGHTRL